MTTAVAPQFSHELPTSLSEDHHQRHPIPCVQFDVLHAVAEFGRWTSNLHLLSSPSQQPSTPRKAIVLQDTSAATLAQPAASSGSGPTTGIDQTLMSVEPARRPRSLQSFQLSRSVSPSSSVSSVGQVGQYSDQQQQQSQSTDGAPRTRKRRLARSKTVYNFAHPPPNTRLDPRNALNLRPRVLLQLQYASGSARPKPVYEVVPSSILSARLTNKSDASWKDGREMSKRKVAPGDLLVVKTGDYDSSHDDKGLSNGDNPTTSMKRKRNSWHGRESIGVIRDTRGSKDMATGSESRKPPDGDAAARPEAEITMEDGKVWQAFALSTGAYEFVTTDEHGLQLKARWISRPNFSRHGSSNHSKSNVQLAASTSSHFQQQGPLDRKFVFSTISPGSRRHPIIGSMTNANIEVLDTYSMPSATSWISAHHQSSSLGSPGSSKQLGVPQAQDTVPIATDASLRKLLTVTGIWVAFRESWSTAYHYRNLPATPTTPAPMESPSRSRYSSPSISADPSSAPFFTSPNAGKPTRTQSMQVHPSPASSQSSPSDGTGGKLKRGFSKLRPQSLSLPSSALPERRSASLPMARTEQSEFQVGRSATVTGATTTSPGRAAGGRLTATSNSDSAYGSIRRRRRDSLKIYPVLAENETEMGEAAAQSGVGAGPTARGSDASTGEPQHRESALITSPSSSSHLKSRSEAALPVSSSSQGDGLHGATARRRVQSAVYESHPMSLDVGLAASSAPPARPLSVHPQDLDSRVKQQAFDVDGRDLLAGRPRRFASLRRWASRLRKRGRTNDKS